MRLRAGIAAIAVLAAACDEKHGGTRGIMESRAHERLAPELGDFIYAIDSAAVIPPSTSPDTAYIRLFVSSTDTSCAGITVFWQGDGPDTVFVQGYGIRSPRTPDCTGPQRKMDLRVYVGGFSKPRHETWVAVQPDASERHFPLNIPGADSLPPPAASADTDPDVRPAPPPPKAKPVAPKRRPPSGAPVRQ
jgi:hypothetical protein